MHERRGETIENRQASVRERDQCDGFKRSRNQVEKYRIGLGQRHTEKISNSENNMLSIMSTYPRLCLQAKHCTCYVLCCQHLIHELFFFKIQWILFSWSHHKKHVR